MPGIDDIKVFDLAQLETSGGRVMKGMCIYDPGYSGFGEAYFSSIENGAVKAWKRHSRMTSNLIVPIGNVKFVFYNEDHDNYREEYLGSSRYKRLYVPPGVWFGFKGMADGISLVLNLADIVHDPAEVEKTDFKRFNYQW